MALRHTRHVLQTRHSVQWLQWILRRFSKMQRGNYCRFKIIIKFFEFWTKSSVRQFERFWLKTLKKNWRDQLLKNTKMDFLHDFNPASGRSKRAISDFEKAAPVGRESCILQTLGCRSLVCRGAYRPRCSLSSGSYNSINFFNIDIQSASKQFLYVSFYLFIYFFVFVTDVYLFLLFLSVSICTLLEKDWEEYKEELR